MCRQPWQSLLLEIHLRPLHVSLLMLLAVLSVLLLLRLLVVAVVVVAAAVVPRVHYRQQLPLGPARKLLLLLWRQLLRRQRTRPRPVFHTPPVLPLRCPVAWAGRMPRLLPPQRWSVSLPLPCHRRLRAPAAAAVAGATGMVGVERPRSAQVCAWLHLCVAVMARMMAARRVDITRGRVARARDIALICLEFQFRLWERAREYAFLLCAWRRPILRKVACDENDARAPLRVSLSQPAARNRGGLAGRPVVRATTRLAWAMQFVARISVIL